MNSTPSAHPENFSDSPLGPAPGALKNAARFWELRRIAYNAVLAVVVILWVSLSWPHFRPAMNLQALVFLVFAGTLANVCYCAAYLVDLPLQASPLHAAWKRWRWTLWVLGTLFAVLIANYWIADEIYPYIR